MCTHMRLSQALLANNMKSYVTENLWTGDATKPGIAFDLDYVVNHWSDDSGDPWEEVCPAARVCLYGLPAATVKGALSGACPMLPL